MLECSHGLSSWWALDPNLAARDELLDLRGQADDGVRRAGARGHHQHDRVHVDALEAVGDEQAARHHGVAHLVVADAGELDECRLAERDVQLKALGLRHSASSFCHCAKKLFATTATTKINNNIYTNKSKEKAICLLFA
jgi:hypothetical protein